jgi:hypothetical protein
VKNLNRLFVSLLLLSGCGDPLTPPWLIDKPRVLGARIEATADPARPWLRPGEEAQVKWLVVAPEGAPPMRWAFALCLPDPRGNCQTPLGTMTGDGAPVLSFALPPAEMLGTANQLVLAGVFCAGGAPTLVAGAPGCEGMAAPTAVVLPLPLERGTTNHNPSLTAATFTVGGAPWPAGDDCAALPRFPAGAAAQPVAVTLAGQRELYQSTANAEGAPTERRETIQLSHFTTAGKLPRQLSFIEAAEQSDPATLSVDWTPPPAAEVPAAGLTVRFFFVARDLRGGLDWTARTLCVTPPQP